MVEAALQNSGVAAVAPLWDLDFSDESEIAALAIKLLDAVDAAARKLPTLRSTPELMAVKDIRERVQREFVTDNEHRDEDTLNTQNALHNLLEECLSRHPEHKEVVTTARLPTAVNLFPQRPEHAQDAVQEVGVLFRSFLLNHAGKPNLGGALSIQAQAGLIVTSLVLRQGVCSLRILSALLRVIDQPLRFSGEWQYLHITLGGDARHPPEHRRIFLDVVSAALFIRFAAECAEVVFPTKLRELKNSVMNRKQATLINQCYQAFVKEAGGANVQHIPGSVKQLLQCRLDSLRLEANPVLSEYAAGRLRSTSFAEADWLRWQGLRSLHDDSGDAEDKQEALPGVTVIPKQDAYHTADHIVAADLDVHGMLASIRAILKKPRAESIKALRSLVDDVRNDQGAHSPQALLAQWVYHSLAEKKNKGKHLKASTIKYNLGIFGSRMLAGFSECVNQIPDDEELRDIYLWIIEQAASSGHESNLASVIRSFDQFMRKELGRESGTSLEGLPLSVGHYHVSAHAISPQEFGQLVKMINGPSSTILTESGKSFTTSVVTLAYRLGLRRSEVLGIESGDIHAGSSPELILRDNQYRTMKTVNGRRRVPLGLLQATEYEALQDHTIGLGHHDAVFRHGKDGKPVADHRIIPQVKRMLLAVTGDPRIHFHHLRHSAASWYFFALMAEQVWSRRYSTQLSFIQDIASLQDLAEEHLLSRFRPLSSRAYAVSELLGHGSPTTTFGHYIHVLDLLLFMAVDPSRDYGDQQVKLAALMMSKQSRVFQFTPSESLQSLVKKYPERVVIHPPISAQDSNSNNRSSNAGISFDLLEQEWEKALASGDKIAEIDPVGSELKVPAPGALRQAAAGAITVLNEAIQKNGASARDAIALLAIRRLKNMDWSSVDRNELFQIIEGISGGQEDAMTDLFEVQQVTYGARRKRQIQKVEHAQLKKLERTKKKAGKFRVRLRDFRQRSSSQRPESKNRKRQKAQPGVTWAVLATAIFTCRNRAN